MSQLTTTMRTGSERVRILSVSPASEDHDRLRELLDPTYWTIQRAESLSSGIARLREQSLAIVVCERNLMPGTWREMLAEIADCPQPPLLIVTSRTADDYLWAEALNLGAYDVLPKPFDPAEVTRVMGLARLHWENQSHPVSLVEETLAAC